MILIDTLGDITFGIEVFTIIIVLVVIVMAIAISNVLLDDFNIEFIFIFAGILFLFLNFVGVLSQFYSGIGVLIMIPFFYSKVKQNRSE